jgi:spermidine synthase
MGFMPGYWSGPGIVRDVPILLRGRDAWMSISPLEFESQEIGIRFARGHVLVFGLGMGWAAAAAAANPAVAAITIVEADCDVIALHHALDPFAQLPAAARAKLRLIQGDAFTYLPDAPVDLLMPDIWLPLVSDGRVDEVRRMQANIGAAAIYFWGQELELARHAVAAGSALDDAGIAATIAATGLPLIGSDFSGYAVKVAAAARQWMRERWLPGHEPPW